MSKHCDALNINALCLSVSRALRSIELHEACINLDVKVELVTLINSVVALSQKVESNFINNGLKH